MRIGFREWRLFYDVAEGHPVLYSTFMNVAWETGTLKADQLPERVSDASKLGQLHGVHSIVEHPPKTGHRFLTSPTAAGPTIFVRGAVDPSGRVVEHDDGVLRSEFCRVLAVRLTMIFHRPLSCRHEELLVTNIEMGSGHFVIGPCLCSLDTMLMPAPQVYTRFTMSGLEDELRAWYEVPQLPDGAGPWRKPWGQTERDG